MRARRSDLNAPTLAGRQQRERWRPCPEGGVVVSTATDNGQLPPGLLPQHWADLQSSGLMAETVAAAGLYSEADPARVAALLGRSLEYARRLGSCLVFPYPGPDGAPTGYHRVKPTNPQPARDESPKPRSTRPAGRPATARSS